MVHLIRSLLLTGSARHAKLGVLMLCVSLCVGLGACATSEPSAPTQSAVQSPVALDEAHPWAAGHKWQHQSLPTKKQTRFSLEQRAGRWAVRADAKASASLLRQKLAYTLQEDSQNSQASQMLRFSWKSERLVEEANMALREAEDSVVRVILSFEGDRSKLSAKNRMLSELALVLTGEEMPYATLMYVWCNSRPVNEVIINPRTDRIRKLVLESGKAHLGRWLDYERDIRADYIRAFGEDPGALTGIAIMTDTDNTQSQATAWYGPISLQAAKTK
jgi:hypothetical protein